MVLTTSREGKRRRSPSRPPRFLAQRRVNSLATRGGGAWSKHAATISAISEGFLTLFLDFWGSIFKI